MRRIIFFLTPIVILAVLIAMPLSQAQAAGSITGADMIAIINGWRTGYWSNSLIENSALDACAQATADEMARIGAGDHLANLGYPGASTRCKSYGFEGNVTENWAAAYGSYGTTTWLAEQWSDAAHMYPATEQKYCYVGVGISSASDGKVYYILQAGAISGDTSCSANPISSGSTGTNGETAATEDTSNYVPPIITSTPDYDGNIYHVVANGQTLYTIATYYGVTTDQIKTLNNLTSDTIYVGNKLLISHKPTPTITLTRTATVMMPTRTRTSTPSPVTPSPTLSATPTAQATGTAGIKIDRQWFGFGLLNLSAVGLFVVVLFFFLKPMRQKRRSISGTAPSEKAPATPDEAAGAEQPAQVVKPAGKAKPVKAVKPAQPSPSKTPVRKTAVKTAEPVETPVVKKTAQKAAKPAADSEAKPSMPRVVKKSEKPAEETVVKKPAQKSGKTPGQPKSSPKKPKSD